MKFQIIEMDLKSAFELKFTFEFIGLSGSLLEYRFGWSIDFDDGKFE